MAVSAFLILGAGYTGSRVAERLRARGFEVVATSGRPETYDAWQDIEAGTRVLYSIPPADGEVERLRRLEGRASRVVYLSSTGVYGETRDVDQHTAPAPRTARERARLVTEERVLSGPWSSMVLRPAAIYGPWRGVHESLRRGEFKLMGDGSNFVSRIHVDDLAALAEAALLSNEQGVWPVADEEPCESREMCEFCCRLLHLPMPPSVPREQLTETRRANRRVDGRAVCRLLGVSLVYPSYKVGVPACLRTEDNLNKTT